MALEKRYYSKNPVTEVVFDIRLANNLNVEESQLANLQAKLNNNFAGTELRRSIVSSFEINTTDHEAKKSVRTDGFQFWNKLKTEVIQARFNGYSFSRLQPYEKWDIHFPEAMRNWQLYKDEFKADHISRMGLRFINNFVFASTKIDLDSYFVAFPAIPKGLADAMEGFFQQIVIPFEDGIKAIVTVAPGQSATEKSSVLLDIDVFVSPDVSIQDDPGPWFDKLHVCAEKIFESHITESTRELIK